RRVGYLRAGGAGRVRRVDSADRGARVRRVNSAAVASRVGDIVVDCTDPERLAQFWCPVLGYRVFDRDDTGVAIRGATVSPDILFIRVPERKAAKNRIHF